MNDDDAIMLAGTGTGDETPAASSPPHHRQPGESSVAHAAFLAWLDLGPTRSLPKVAAGLSKSVSLLKRWSARWRWADRLTAYEAEQAELDRLADVKAAEQRAAVRAARRASLEDVGWELGEQMLAKAREMLKFPLARKVVEMDTATGKQVVVIKPGPWRFRDVVALFVEGNRLQRLAVGLPPDKVEVTGADNAPLLPAAGLAPVVNIIIEGDAPDYPVPQPGMVEPDTGGV